MKKTIISKDELTATLALIVRSYQSQCGVSIDDEGKQVGVEFDEDEQGGGLIKEGDVIRAIGEINKMNGYYGEGSVELPDSIELKIT